MHYVQIQKLPGNEDIKLPQKMSELASGFDVVAALQEDVVLQPGQRTLIPTGLAMAMPAGLKHRFVLGADWLSNMELPASTHRVPLMRTIAEKLKCC